MSLQKNNEKITNFFDHEYIGRSFLFNTRFMQRSFLYIYDKKTWIVKHVVISINC
jgi:hypothetical protein